MKKVCMYYFTGSGNTLKIAKHIQTGFLHNGLEKYLLNCRINKSLKLTEKVEEDIIN